jgi:hypothetical protein
MSMSFSLFMARIMSLPHFSLLLPAALHVLAFDLGNIAALAPLADKEDCDADHRKI